MTAGWVVGHDQLKNKYKASEEAIALWRDIKEEFSKHNVDLVVLAAPPRPLFVPQTAIKEMEFPADVNLAVLDESFSGYVSALNSAGIVTPDLSAIAQSQYSDGFYFARDTHWTPMGAALSVAHLNAAMGNVPVETSLEKIGTTGSYEEKGSLAGVVEEVCGSRPELEVVPEPQYAQQGTAASLLGDAPEKNKVALVGTSFSNRYQRDTYLVADALAFIMDVQVDNFSISGGGSVGSMEAFIRSGDLANGVYKTIVWETPYSIPLTQVGGLRQTLGALQTSGGVSQVGELDTQIGKDWSSVSHSFSLSDVQGLEIETATTETGHLVVELIDDAGSKIRTKLVKSKRVAAEMRSSKWALALNGMPDVQIARIKLRLPKAASQETATIRFFN